jgi:signal peptidase I
LYKSPAEISITPSSLPRPKLPRWEFVREIIDLLVLIMTIYALVNLASVRFIVQGPSMQPTFETGQFLIVSRVHYLLGKPEYGDIVVFHYPNNPDEDYIKRVIGLPGDTVELRDEVVVRDGVEVPNTQIYVNGSAIAEPYINEPMEASRCPDKMWTLEANEFFVMGDNRNHSSDSRCFGPVTKDFIVGEVLVRYWPLQDVGIVTKARYP